MSTLKRRPARWYSAGKSVMFQRIQVGFHRSVVDTQELICEMCIRDSLAAGRPTGTPPREAGGKPPQTARSAFPPVSVEHTAVSTLPVSGGTAPKQNSTAQPLILLELLCLGFLFQFLADGFRRGLVRRKMEVRRQFSGCIIPVSYTHLIAAQITNERRPCSKILSTGDGTSPGNEHISRTNGGKNLSLIHISRRAAVM